MGSRTFLIKGYLVSYNKMSHKSIECFTLMRFSSPNFIQPNRLTSNFKLYCINFNVYFAFVDEL